MKDTLNLVFTIDSNYLQHFAVALISAIENNRDLELRVFVISDIESPTLLNEVAAFFKTKYKLEITLLSLDSKLFENYTITRHISKATYFRLLIADIMPTDIDCALFLDSDIIVKGSLKELISWNFKDKYLFAASDVNAHILSRFNNMGVVIKDYFNAGIMLLNLKLWREDNASAHLLSTASQYMDKLEWWDQDVLNIYFANKWGILPGKFNVRHRHGIKKGNDTIIHYVGSTKPWNYLSNHPLKKYYWHYLKLSPFKSFKYKDFSIRTLLVRIVYFYQDL